MLQGQRARCLYCRKTYPIALRTLRDILQMPSTTEGRSSIRHTSVFPKIEPLKRPKLRVGADEILKHFVFGDQHSLQINYRIVRLQGHLANTCNCQRKLFDLPLWCLPVLDVNRNSPRMVDILHANVSKHKLAVGMSTLEEARTSAATATEFMLRGEGWYTSALAIAGA